MLIEICSLFIGIFLVWFITSNIHPFIRKDVYGYYLQVQETHYVMLDTDYTNAKQIVLKVKHDSNVVKVPVNPWLNYWKLAKYVLRVSTWKFENEEVEKLWNLSLEDRRNAGKD